MLGEFTGRVLLDVTGRGQYPAALISPVLYVTTYRFPIRAPAGMVTDLASLPGVLRIFFRQIDETAAPAIIHDWLYCSHITTRREADDIFFEALLTAGVSRWRAALYWLGVRVGGLRGWNRDRQRDKA